MRTNVRLVDSSSLKVLNFRSTYRAELSACLRDLVFR